jgi:hypothetical protein
LEITISRAQAVAAGKHKASAILRTGTLLLLKQELLLLVHLCSISVVPLKAILFDIYIIYMSDNYCLQVQQFYWPVAM